MKDFIPFIDYVDNAMTSTWENMQSVTTFKALEQDMSKNFTPLIVSAIIYVFFVAWLSQYRNVEYLSQGTSEAMSFTLWNIASCIGLITFCLYLIFPNRHRLCNLCAFSLKFACSTGALAIGVIVSYHFLLSVLESNSYFKWSFYNLYIITFMYTLINYI